MKDISTANYEAAVELNEDATLTVRANAPEIGNGGRNVLSQTAAEVLRVPIDWIKIEPCNTHNTPESSGVFGSRITVLMGNAVKQAAEELRALLLEKAATLSDHDVKSLSMVDGEFTGPQGNVLSLAELAKGTTGKLIGKGASRPKADSGRIDICTWEINAGVAVVAVDEECGSVRCTCYVSAADVGKAIHPLRCEGQEEGSVMFGMGTSLLEEQVFDGAVLLNASPVDYMIPRFRTLPDIFHSVLIENEDGPGPFGSKGMAEGGLAPVAPAMAAAVRDAVGAVAHSLPLSPERIYRLIS
jgi:CO/xanthine dehydrogenase Mo-binding subunit